MRISLLQAGSRGPILDLRDSRGLVGFVAEDDPLWGDLLAGLRAAYASGGGQRGAGPVVEGADGPVRVGTEAFEARLAPVLAAHGLRREEYAALWFGEGSAETWLAAAGALLAGRAAVLEMRGGEGGVAGSRGDTADDAAAVASEDLVRDARGEVDRLARSLKKAEGLESRLRAAREEEAVARGDAEAATMAWVRERQDAETRLLLYRDRERELRALLRSTDEAGEEGACGRCGRELGDRAGRVREALREEWEAVVQDGRWWRRRRDQLEGKPRDLQAAEQRAVALAAEVDGLAEELARRKARGPDLEAATRRLDGLSELAARLRGGVGGAGGAGAGRVDGGAAGEVRRARLVSDTRRRVRARIHGKVVALTGGRLLGTFPDLFAAWSAGGGRGGADPVVLEVAARIAMVELATGAGVKLDSVVFPDPLHRLHREDRPRVLAALARLARGVSLVLAHAAPRVAAAAPECFDFLYRPGGAGDGGRVRRRRSGLGAVWLGSG